MDSPWNLWRGCVLTPWFQAYKSDFGLGPSRTLREELCVLLWASCGNLSQKPQKTDTTAKWEDPRPSDTGAVKIGLGNELFPLTDPVGQQTMRYHPKCSSLKKLPRLFRKEPNRMHAPSFLSNSCDLSNFEEKNSKCILLYKCFGVSPLKHGRNLKGHAYFTGLYNVIYFKFLNINQSKKLACGGQSYS